MGDYVITTDNNSDLPESYFKEHNIGCVYLSYSMDDQNYTHDRFLEPHEFYERMRKGAMPVTAQANPSDVREMMEPYLKEGKDILHISFSSALSGIYNSAKIAADELAEDYPQRTVIVIDSCAASLGQGLLIHLALQKKEAGEDLDAVAKWVEENKNHIAHLFTVEDLFHLHRGGRVSKTTAIVGRMLNIKPVLHVDEEGRLISVGKSRGRKKSIQELVNLMEQKIGSRKDSCHTVFISHGDCEKDAEYLEKLVREKFPVENVIINYVSATIGAHSGPGTLALFFVSDQK